MTQGMEYAERAWALASESRAALQFREAALFEANALAHGVPTAAALERHAGTIQMLVDRANAEDRRAEAFSLLEELLGRLGRALEQVNPTELRAVVTLIDRTQSRYEELAAVEQAKAAPPADSDEDRSVGEVVQAIARATWNWAVPTSPVEAVARLKTVAAALSSLDDGDPRIDASSLARLRAQQQSLRIAVTIDESLNELVEVELRASKQADVRVGNAMLLQSEASLRGLLASLVSVDAGRTASVLTRLDEITNALQTAQSSEARKRSVERWKRHLEEHATSIGLANEWSAPEAGAAALAKCEQQIDRLRSMIEAANEVWRELETREQRSEAQQWIRKFTKSLETAHESQRRAYSWWALRRVESCFSAALKHKGTVWDDKDKMGLALIEEIGEVNPALLSAEVSRAYSEVLEHFMSKLEAPDAGASFDKAGSRLHALKQIATHSKKKLSAF